jgi:pyruvate dehydrogenase E2 component (dihydrolipoamide acetyltransferase)
MVYLKYVFGFIGVCPTEDLLPIPIKMPALSPTMTTGHLLVWHKNINDSVQTGDLLLEIETDKAVMEVEATQSGILDHLAVLGGTNDVVVGKIIAVLRNSEEEEGIGITWLREQGAPEEPLLDVPSVLPPSSPIASSPPASRPDNTFDSVATKSLGASGSDESTPQTSLSKDHVFLSEIQAEKFTPISHQAPRGNGASPQIANSDQTTASSNQGHRIVASPLARKWAEHHGVNLHHVLGTGPRGRIVKEDVLYALSHPVKVGQSRISDDVQLFQQVLMVNGLKNDLETRVGNSMAPAGQSMGHRPADSVVFKGSSSPSEQKSQGETGKKSHQSLEQSREPVGIALSGMRRTIAQRLTMSKQTVPHFALSLECRMDTLLTLRGDMNGETKDLSVNDFMVRACAMALRAVPEMRLMWGDETHAVQHQVVDLAVAVSVPGGLITPIVRDADTKPLRVLAVELKSLIARARAGQLSSHEYQGGLFTLSNLGMMGIDQFTPIINPPHTGILAIGATKKRPIVDDNGFLQVGQTMMVTISADHRTIDGSVAATFLTTFQRLIQHPLALVS